MLSYPFFHVHVALNSLPIIYLLPSTVNLEHLHIPFGLAVDYIEPFVVKTHAVRDDSAGQITNKQLHSWAHTNLSSKVITKWCLNAGSQL